jgi:homogentisate 1,2-dioxygenase
MVDVTQADQPKCRGYICEIYESHFIIPDGGPIGANSLALPQHFLSPVAWYEDTTDEWQIITKYMGTFHEYSIHHSPFDTVGWSGNYVPYKYDLELYATVGSISYDHPDPSIFTVLTAQTAEPGCAVCDFVIFPPRWLVAEHTFRPPYYHRNTMTEYMGNITGVYDAKEEGFVPGGSSLHSCMAGHGPEAAVFEKASDE